MLSVSVRAYLFITLKVFMRFASFIVLTAVRAFSRISFMIKSSALFP